MKDFRLDNVRDHKPSVGDYVVPDGWSPFGSHLEASDGFSDSSFPGCAFRLPSWKAHMGHPFDYKLAVNVTRTGDDWYCGKGTTDKPRYKNRVKVEFVGDGDPSTFTHGWLYHD